MTPKNDYVLYEPLSPPTLVVLPYYRPPRRRGLRRCLVPAVAVAVAVLLLAAAAYLLFPSDPTLRIARIRLNRVRVDPLPRLTVDLSFSLTLRVLNRDFFSLDYDSLAVSVAYRGRELGLVASSGGRVRARGSSFVDATLDLDGFEVVHDAFYLIQDLARGIVPFDTDSTLQGNLGFFFFKIPLKARVSCEVYVNTNDQTIVRQDCYPK